ncbi:MAG: sigma-70 family RNA polymerase sigma factor [Bacteroidota bacterium]
MSGAIKVSYNKHLFFKRRNRQQKPDITSSAGFEEVYNACFDKMYEIGLYQTKDQETTRELIQEFFTSMWEKRHTLVDKDEVEHYLIRLFKYRIIDHFRAEATRQRHINEASQSYEVANHSTEELVLHNELKDNVEGLIGQLSLQSQKVYRMSHEQGMSNKEIASSLLLSERAITYHLSKAASFLQENLHSVK